MCTGRTSRTVSRVIEESPSHSLDVAREPWDLHNHRCPRIAGGQRWRREERMSFSGEYSTFPLGNE